MLVGKFAIISGETYYREVEIVKEDNDLLLLKDDQLGDQPISYFVVHKTAILTGMSEEGVLLRNWFIFDTKEERDNWLKWADTPDPDCPEHRNIGENILNFKK